jgi:asparagine synthase (glutamine-hydrolysing)
MCGICGVLAVDGLLDPEIAAALPAMTHALRHRGPDGDGFFDDPFAALGHRRLAIIDREGGVQPMSNEARTCWITFNGEIYNHRPLREYLIARGHRFRTHSDTETIVHAYEEFGVDCVERLEGMFAFAIYDQRRRELFIARDRLGKKPLFYAVLNGIFHFASEIKAIAASPAWDDRLELTSLESYLSLGYFLAPETIYRSVRCLEPGHWLRVRNGRVEMRRYWDVERFDDDRREPAALVDELDGLLRRAVRDRLESEVPLGAFLSGGIDSGLVVSYMSEAIGSRLLTTSVGFADAAHNELRAAAVTARHFDTSHAAEVVEPRLDEVLDPLLGTLDQPLADSSAIPTLYVSRAARRQVTVALSGDGGDEVFGGYDFRYVPHAIESRIREYLPGRPGRQAAGWLGRRWPRSSRLPRALRLGSILQNIGRAADEAYFADLCFIKPREVAGLLGRPEPSVRHSRVFEAVTDAYRGCPSSSPVQRAQYADLKTYLPNDVLVKVDRMSMLESLEVRCPLLDHRIVEFAFRIPTATKMPHLESKHLLRAIARRRLPAELLALPKRGFTAPVARWIAGPYRETFRDNVFGAGSTISSLVDAQFLRGLFDEHCRGRRDNSYALWAIFAFERWIRLKRDAAQTHEGVRPIEPRSAATR